MKQKEKVNEDVKYLIRRIKETTNLIKDARYVDAYHKSLGINQKLADLQGKIESGEIEVCDSTCSDKSSKEKMIKYGKTEEMEKAS